MEIGDEVGPFGKIVKFTKTQVIFESGKRKTIAKVMALKERFGKSFFTYMKSHDAIPDWTNEKEVDSYYESFNQWKTVIRMGDTKTPEILEVKDNKVFKDGEYYLPYAYVNGIPSKAVYQDGYVWGYAVKKNNNWYSTMGGPIVNLFYVKQILPKNVLLVQESKKKWKKELSDVEYLQKIPLNRLNSSDLNLLKKELINLFPDSIFPYTYKSEKPVTFSKGDFNEIKISHRNRTGYLNIDNGYYGPQPYGNDYYAILEARPYFTNQVGYSPRLEQSEIKFNTNALDKLAEKLIPIWDRAIENNAKNWK